MNFIACKCCTQIICLMTFSKSSILKCLRLKIELKRSIDLNLSVIVLKKYTTKNPRLHLNFVKSILKLFKNRRKLTLMCEKY